MSGPDKLCLTSPFSSTNTHILSPPWAAVATALVPLRSCNRAADLLLDWFDAEELKKVVGGERWWQVRGLDGLEAEWVTERKFLKEGLSESLKENVKARYNEGKLSVNELDILRMNNLERVMVRVYLLRHRMYLTFLYYQLYIHGGKRNQIIKILRD